ncbi:N-acetyl-D-Glu racemase DgcA [Sphingosinicella soli]|uniref:Dipeptide epimerase n=1 Tax=Sphingosinicella soli TaxID=333708 RepID=A0A7W7F6R5_9SPHN|nr:N-acetyl-D-Glu racemase DgcA [Sphingosinicella soli]MBB4632601.1 L-alanine-DL-glutamate epimerase-like enolase superfamily enzyme [Sphingosinicella soli]
MRTLSARSDSFPLVAPFRISRGVKTAADVVTVEIAADGHVGRGEGVPYPRYGETIESALAAIETVRAALEAGAGRTEISALMPPSAARNAVDCALWDLEARLAGTSVTALLGRPPIAPTPTALTISLDTPEAMGAAALKLAGVPLIKIKVDRSDPAAQIKAVRAAAPKPRLIVDPNESWTIAEVRELQSLLVDLRVDLLEQPLPAAEDAALEGFRSAVPIAADESAHVAADLDALMQKYQVVNIKLDKTGGLTAALELADAATAKGMGLMTGCMVCSSLAIAPALIVAANAAFADLDGPVWLANDRPGGVRCTDGILSPPSLWGSA